MFRRFGARSVRPLARTDGLSVTVSGDETLVYDRTQFVIHRLNADTAMIWRLADGTRDLAMLAAEARLPAKVVKESLSVLAGSDLVKAESLGMSAVTRRRLIGAAAGAATAMSFIAQAAASPNDGDHCQGNENFLGTICCRHSQYEWTLWTCQGFGTHPTGIHGYVRCYTGGRPCI